VAQEASTVFDRAVGVLYDPFPTVTPFTPIAALKMTFAR
jgi:hypothetical protein